MNDEDLKRLNSRLSNIETHLINLNQPHSELERLLKIFSQPIMLDDRKLVDTFREISKTLHKFTEDTNTVDIKSCFNEIKYIAIRLTEIEKRLDKIQNEGVKKEIDFQFTVDGYELVRKPSKHSNKLESEDSDECIIKLLDTLSEKESTVVRYRIGLLGQDKKTYAQIGKLMNLTPNRIRVIYMMTLRKIKHPTRKNLVSKITHKQFIQEIST